MVTISDLPSIVFRLLTSSLINCTNTHINDVPHSREFFHSLHSHPFYLCVLALCFVLCACTVTIGIIHILFITYYTSESERRFFMFYLASTAPMVSVFSLIAMCMPRVWLLCHLLAFLVFSVALWIVICLLMHIFQGHNSLVSRMSERLQHIEVATPPFCCFCVCPCLPKVSLHGKRIRICECMVLQTPFVRLVATFVALIIYFEYQEDSAFYLKVLDVITLPSLLAGIYGMHILVTTVSRLDEVISYRYVVIFRLLDLYFLVFGLQQPVFDFTARSGLFGCGTLLPAVETACFWRNAFNIGESFVVTLISTVLMQPSKTSFFDKHPSCRTLDSARDSNYEMALENSASNSVTSSVLT